MQHTHTVWSLCIGESWIYRAKIAGIHGNTGRLHVLPRNKYATSWSDRQYEFFCSNISRWKCASSTWFCRKNSQLSKTACFYPSGDLCPYDLQCKVLSPWTGTKFIVSTVKKIGMAGIIPVIPTIPLPWHPHRRGWHARRFRWGRRSWSFSWCCRPWWWRRWYRGRGYSEFWIDSIWE